MKKYIKHIILRLTGDKSIRGRGVYTALFILSLLFFSCQKSDLKNMQSVNSSNLPDEISRNVHMVYSDSGRIKFILDAPLIHKYTTDTNYTEFPEGVHGVFYNRYGEKTSQLDAGYCLKVKKDEEVIFRKDVHFENNKGETLISDEIYLVNDTIHSDTTVFIRTPNLILEGVGLVAPQDFSTYTLLNPTGVYYPEDEKMKGKFK